MVPFPQSVSLTITNFCVDFPDYVIGNVRQSSIAEIWNGEKAERFRRYRREKALPVCARCGARFMSETPK